MRPRRDARSTALATAGYHPARMWPLGLLLTLAAGWCLASVIAAIVRGRRLLPTDPRRPRIACLVVATVVAALALTIAALATLVDLGVGGKPELPIASMLAAAMVAGLAALAQALRLVAVPAAARPPHEDLLVALMGAVAIGVTCCYGNVPEQRPGVALVSLFLMILSLPLVIRHSTGTKWHGPSIGAGWFVSLVLAFSLGTFLLMLFG